MKSKRISHPCCLKVPRINKSKSKEWVLHLTQKHQPTSSIFMHKTRIYTIIHRNPRTISSTKKSMNWGYFFEHQMAYLEKVLVKKKTDCVKDMNSETSHSVILKARKIQSIFQLWILIQVGFLSFSDIFVSKRKKEKRKKYRLRQGKKQQLWREKHAFVIFQWSGLVQVLCSSL